MKENQSGNRQVVQTRPSGSGTAIEAKAGVERLIALNANLLAAA